jgi:hypothetical protein
MYAVLPEDEFPEPHVHVPLSPSIYAVFPEDEIEIIEVLIPQVAVAVAGGFNDFD